MTSHSRETATHQDATQQDPSGTASPTFHVVSPTQQVTAQQDLPGSASPTFHVASPTQQAAAQPNQPAPAGQDEASAGDTNFADAGSNPSSEPWEHIDANAPHQPVRTREDSQATVEKPPQAPAIEPVTPPYRRPLLQQPNVARKRRTPDLNVLKARETRPAFDVTTGLGGLRELWVDPTTELNGPRKFRRLNDSTKKGTDEELDENAKAMKDKSVLEKIWFGLAKVMNKQPATTTTTDTTAATAATTTTASATSTAPAAAAATTTASCENPRPIKQAVRRRVHFETDVPPTTANPQAPTFPERYSAPLDLHTTTISKMQGAANKHFGLDNYDGLSDDERAQIETGTAPDTVMPEVAQGLRHEVSERELNKHTVVRAPFA